MNPVFIDERLSTFPDFYKLADKSLLWRILLKRIHGTEQSVVDEYCIEHYRKYRQPFCESYVTRGSRISDSMSFPISRLKQSLMKKELKNEME